MHSSLAAVVLCICAQTVAAQCVDTDLLVRDTRVGVDVIKTSAASPAAAPARTGGELIKTAAAGTRDAPGAARDMPPVVRDASARMQGDEEDHPRSGTAMLLAALAVMSGIALRRFGASNQ
jgi:hypothetical protein